jgi:hypothetical protein
MVASWPGEVEELARVDAEFLKQSCVLFVVDLIGQPLLGQLDLAAPSPLAHGVEDRLFVDLHEARRVALGLG